MSECVQVCIHDECVCVRVCVCMSDVRYINFTPRHSSHV